MRSILVQFLLALNILLSSQQLTVVAENVKFEEVLTKCCTSGEDHAENSDHCGSIPPISVNEELISSCLYSSEVCCESKLRVEQCKAGVRQAQNGGDCHASGNKTGSEFYKNCCESCKIGLVFGTSQEECSLELKYGSPFDDSFNYCCNEVKNDEVAVIPDDMDLCSKFGHMCSQVCETSGDFQIVCKCNPGYELEADKKTCKQVENTSNETTPDDCPIGFTKNDKSGECEDIDECESPEATCNIDTQVCYNTKGSYKCLDIQKPDQPECPNGFKFNEDTSQCDDINECETDLGKISCGKKLCVNTPGGYDCIDIKTITPRTDAFTVNPRKKMTCSKGFKQYFDKCVDIDECATDKNSCASNQNCKNMPGSFECECKIGFMLDKALNACVDINECQINDHDCLDSQRCDNTIGSYTCIRLQSCGTGYTLNAETGTCDDDDECALGRHNCVEPYKCRNTKGSFRCEKVRVTTTTPAPTTTTTTPTPTQRAPTSPRPYVHTHTYTVAPRQYTQSYSRYVTPSNSVDPRFGDWDTRYGSCGVGFQRNSLGACVDIDECYDSNTCRRNQRCVNTNGSYKCINLLTCSGGFTSNDEGTQCIDVDECATGTANCGPDEICKNKPGGYTCSCPAGHTLNAQRRCEDINECEFYRGQVCPGNSECINTQGSYRCDCKEGFKRQGNDDKACADVDECSDIPGLCSQKCINYWGSYRCACDTGFHLSDNNRTCEDIDECEVHKTSNLCMGICQNTHGSYQCECPQGYRLGPDARSCQDIDECTTENVCTGRNEICTNIKGSYRCTYKNCPSDYIDDPGHKNRCKRLSLTCEHGDIECYRRPTSYTYHFITLVSNLSLPPQGRALFTYKGPSWYDNIDFDLKLLHSTAPSSIEQASIRNFQMDKFQNEARLSLMQMLEGPQDIELEMSMTVFRNGQPGGTNVAKILIFVSEFAY